MDTSTYDLPSENKRVVSARERLEQRFNIGKRAQAELVHAVANLHIRDKLVPPDKMGFSCRDGVAYVHYNPGLGDLKGVRVHPHALSQMASVAGIPKLYVNRLINGKPWENDLFSYNMGKLFREGEYLDRRKNPTKFLNRLVGEGETEEVRGFLSRSFNRHLASLPLLRAFVFACGEVQAQPVEAMVSPTRFSLKMFLPHVFEPVDHEFVAIGQNWSNSDFGAGRMKLSLTVMRVSSGTSSVLEDSLSRVHIGSIITDADIEMSEDTAIKEVDAQSAAIRDTVKSQLAPGPVNKILEAIRAAQEEAVPWHRIREVLGRILSKKEIEHVKTMLETGISDIVDLPPPVMSAGGPQATRWWAANMLGWLGSKENDIDRRSAMQEIAGELIQAKVAA
jgi:hypothetical protein